MTVEEASIHGPRDIVAHGAAYLDLKAWQERNRTFNQIAYFTAGPGGGRFNFLEGNGGSAMVHLTNVSPNFFPTLGVLPMLGHGFDEDARAVQRWEECQYACIERFAWRQIFGGDPAILGKKVLLNGKGYAVVGVMPRGFGLGAKTKGPGSLDASPVRPNG